MEEPDNNCQVLKSALDVLGDRWSAIILWGLKDGPMRFVDIQKSTEGINSRTLTQRLLMLEESELVTKHEYKEYPPRTEYKITDKGTELQPIFESMMKWAEKHGNGRACPTNSKSS
jgi:DNA-binding HxlR family transcriptional regulator